MLISLTPEDLALDWSAKQSGITTFAIEGPLAAAAQHGVYQINSGTGMVEDLHYRNPETTAKLASAEGTVPLVGGVLFFSPDVVEKLLAITFVPPLNACTYLGLDDGAPAFKLSLFLDVIKSACCDPGAAGIDVESRARAKLHERLSGIAVHSVVLNKDTASFA